MSWGITPWGLGPWGGGVAGTFYVVSATPMNANTVRVLFSLPPKEMHDRIADDGLNPSNYDVTVTSGPSGAWAPRAVCVRPATLPAVLPEAVDLTLDRTMPGIMTGVETVLRVTVTNVLSVGGDPLVGANYVPLRSLNGVVRETPDRLAETAGTDFSCPPTPNSPAGGTFRVDDDGDYMMDTGTNLTKKLVMRRITTSKGGFFHLPNYGLGMDEKGLAAAWKMNMWRNDARRQILAEPGVAEADVSVSYSNGIFTANVKVRTQQGLTLGFPVSRKLEV